MNAKRLLRIAAAAGGACAAVTGAQILIRSLDRPLPDLPERAAPGGRPPDSPYTDEDLIELYLCLRSSGRKDEASSAFLPEKSGRSFDDAQIVGILSLKTEYIARRFDCSDFHLQFLFRIFRDCGAVLPAAAKELIKDTFLGFRYFMDEPGQDSMCFWSENHQILFAAAEYLAGEQWPAEVFTNSGLTGSQHAAKARVRLMAWFAQRERWGFCEYLSSNYLLEDVAALSGLISFSGDREIALRASGVMDLLWTDVAAACVGTRFTPASSRLYANNKAGSLNGCSILPCINALWGKEALAAALADPELREEEKDEHRRAFAVRPRSMAMNFIALLDSGLYVLPDRIRELALAPGPVNMYLHRGLSPRDLVREDLVGQDPPRIMAQFAAECFTNPEVVDNTAEYFRTNRMLRNSFVYYFKYLDVFPFCLIEPRILASLPGLMPNGVALGSADIAIYRTKRYCLTTLCAHCVGSCGSQEHIWSADIGRDLALFSTQPARDGGYSASPGYWTGNGRQPMSVQDRNVNITIYKLPAGLRPLEFHIARMTHLYMPVCFYDEFEKHENIVFARKGGVFAAVMSDGAMSFRPYCRESAAAFGRARSPEGDDERYIIKGPFDLCRFGGEYHCYVTELSDIDSETYEDFKRRVRANPVSFGRGSVVYKTSGRTVAARYTAERSQASQ